MSQLDPAITLNAFVLFAGAIVVLIELYRSRP